MRMNDYIRRHALAPLAAAVITAAVPANAQDTEGWTLDKCVDYALEHNTDIATGQIDVESGKISLNTARMSRLPDLSASLGSNVYFGRSPSRDASYIDNSQISGSLGVSLSVPVYQGMRIKHEIEKAKIDFEAATQNLALARKNISLNIASLFLQAMYDKEMVSIAKSQLELSTSQLEQSEGQYESGRVPLNEVVRNESLVAADEATLTQNENSYALSLLDLRQAMNLPDSVFLSPVMDIRDIPRIEEIPALSQIYDQSVRLHPSIKYAEASLQSSMIALKTAKSAYQPSVHFSAGYGNSVYSNLTDPTMNTSGFWEQLRNNGNEYIGLSISIPIFSGNSVRNNVKLSRLNVSRQELLLSEAQKSLKKEIEQAYYGAMAAYSTLNSAQKALEAAQLSFENEKASMESGRSDIYDYANAKAEVEQAQATLARSKYDYILRVKILRFYMI
ncbi:MAG: TolC family protein [Bacteroidetes bacterium]|uniref:TolC family protein n=1 Tax=Candidatus Cryptobacteroides excrementipullorum TaxID=2840761 RepID=A0A9D9IT26_9BACT|nr:TolC family protein [Candidatus Cryptobacteroides excrementipullorum]